MPLLRDSCNCLVTETIWKDALVGRDLRGLWSSAAIPDKSVDNRVKASELPETVQVAAK